MESHFKAFTVAVAFCAALAAGPALAQEAAGADHDAPRGDGGGGDSAAIKGFQGNPDGGRPLVPRAEEGRGKAAMTNAGIDLVLPEGGAASLKRRANLKALIANAPKGAAGLPASNVRTGSPLAPPGGGAATHNAIGAVMPGGPAPAHGLPTFSTQAGRAMTAIGTPAKNTGGTNLYRGPVPLNVPTPHASGLNGTMMGRVATGAGTIGGPAKDRSGINGTFIRPNR